MRAKRVTTVAAGLACALGVAACGPSDERIEDGKAELRVHAAELQKTLQEFRTGFWRFPPADAQRQAVDYIQIVSGVADDKDHQLVLTIIQNDIREGGPTALTADDQVLTKPRQFYTDEVCPPPAFRAEFEDDFGVFINLFSRQFGQYFRIDCGY